MSDAIQFSDRERELIRHCVGLDESQHGFAFRNFYIIHPSATEYGTWKSLVARGYAKKHPYPGLLSEADLFFVTTEAALAVCLNGERLADDWIGAEDYDK